MKNTILPLILWSVVICAVAQPTPITWQGKLLDNNGNAISQNNVAMTFVMFDSSTGGNQLWPAIGVVTKTVNVVQGLYSVQLGTGVGDDIAFTATMFSGKTPWLEVKVGTETLPRTEITNVPFALIANVLSASGWENPGELGKTAPNSGKFTSLETESFKIPAGAGTGKMLTSDTDGNAIWTTPYTGLTNLTESNYIYNSKTGVKLKATNSADNVDIVISPKGNGAILLQQPDGTGSGGDNRGNYAVDFQSSRLSPDRVASGEYSFIGGGSNNASIGTYNTVIGGFNNTASHYLSTVCGGSHNTAGLNYATVGGGNGNTASGFVSCINGGYMNNATADFSTVSGGVGNVASGKSSFVAGQVNTAQSLGESVLGLFATTATGSTSTFVASDRLFAIGNGTDENARSNALTILKNGNTTIGGTLKINYNMSGAWFTLPETRGLAGATITSDGDGHTEWTTLYSIGYLFATGNSLGNTIRIGSIDNQDINLITNSEARMILSKSGSISIPAMTTSGILHNNSSGLISSSLIVNNDIASFAAIADSKLATITSSGKVANSATTATSSGISNTIVSRDASGNFTATTITASLSGNASTATTTTHLAGGAQGSIAYQSAPATTAFLPKGTAGQVLTMNAGATAPQWSTPATGTVTSVGGTSPISVVNGGTTPTISIDAASTTTAGSMSAADKTKLDGLTGSQWTTNGSTIYYNSGNVGIGTTSPKAKIDLGTSISNRKIILYSTADNDHEFTGLGLNSDALRFQLANTTGNFRFYGATSASASTELFRIQGNGQITIPAFSTAGIVENSATGVLSSSKGSANQVLKMNSTGTSPEWGNAIPVLTQTQRDGLTATEGMIIYNSTKHKPNFYDGANWMNFDGTPALQIGDNFQGGIIAYIFQPGDPGYIAGQTHGLIAASSDQSTGIQWYNGSNITTGATATTLKSGGANTTAIVTAQGIGSYAAKICEDYTSGGYTDWYLPSKDELNKLYLNQTTIGGFSALTYWTSSETSSGGASSQDFSNGYQTGDFKFGTLKVRAIRVF